jgi:hypothetical protein
MSCFLAASRAQITIITIFSGGSNCRGAQYLDVQADDAAPAHTIGDVRTKQVLDIRTRHPILFERVLDLAQRILVIVAKPSKVLEMVEDGVGAVNVDREEDTSALLDRLALRVLPGR